MNITKITIVFFLLSFIQLSYSQDFKLNSALLIENRTKVANSTDKKPKHIKSKNYRKFNPAFWVFNGALTFYQKVISRQIGAACPYEVSCSRFSRECIHKYGLVKGIALTADRLSRCNDIGSTDMDVKQLNDSGYFIDDPKEYKK